MVICVFILILEKDLSSSKLVFPHKYLKRSLILFYKIFSGFLSATIEQYKK